MDLKDFLMDNALVLIPVLNIIGVMIKGTEKIKNSYIPLILLVCGIAGTIAIMGWNGQSIIQGVLVTGAAVYGHQFVTQCQNCIQSRSKKSSTDPTGESVPDTDSQTTENDG